MSVLHSFVSISHRRSPARLPTPLRKLPSCHRSSRLLLSFFRSSTLLRYPITAQRSIDRSRTRSRVKPGMRTRADQEPELALGDHELEPTGTQTHCGAISYSTWETIGFSSRLHPLRKREIKAPRRPSPTTGAPQFPLAGQLMGACDGPTVSRYRDSW